MEWGSKWWIATKKWKVTNTCVIAAGANIFIQCVNTISDMSIARLMSKTIQFCKRAYWHVLSEKENLIRWNSHKRQIMLGIMAMNDLFIIDTPYVENYFPWKNLIMWDVLFISEAFEKLHRNRHFHVFSSLFEANRNKLVPEAFCLHCWVEKSFYSPWL